MRVLAFAGTGLLLAACAGTPGTSSSTAATVEATQDATAAASDGASGGAGSGGNAGSSDEVPFPTAEETELLSHVPESFRDTCERPEDALAPGDPGSDPNIVAHLDCFPDEGPSEVGFTQYATTEAMDQAFDQVVEFFGLSDGDCSEGGSGHGPYNIAGEAVGRVLCSPQALGETGSVMHWTDERLDIKAYAASDDPDIAQLYAWWTGDSGPIE